MGRLHQMNCSHGDSGRKMNREVKMGQPFSNLE